MEADRGRRLGTAEPWRWIGRWDVGPGGRCPRRRDPSLALLGRLLIAEEGGGAGESRLARLF